MTGRASTGERIECWGEECVIINQGTLRRLEAASPVPWHPQPHIDNVLEGVVCVEGDEEVARAPLYVMIAS